MAAPVKKLKPDGGGDAGQFRGVIVYILPTKIQKKRLESIYNCARSLNVTVLEKFRYERNKYLSDNRFQDCERPLESISITEWFFEWNVSA